MIKYRDMGKENNILLMYVGGTVGMKGMNSPDDNNRTQGTFEEILECIPIDKLKENGINLTYPKQKIQPISVGNIDSQDIGKWAQEIYNQRNQINGAVIIHENDTIPHTSSTLSFMFNHLPFPVILTGGNNPISANRTDARQNVISSIYIAAGRYILKNKLVPAPIIPEVCIYTSKGPTILRGNRCEVYSTDGKIISPFYPKLGDLGELIRIDNSVIMPYPERNFTLNLNLESNVLYRQETIINQDSINLILGKAKGALLLLNTSGRNIGTYSKLQKMIDSIPQEIKSNKFIAMISSIGNGLDPSQDVLDLLNDNNICCSFEMTGPAALAKTRHLLANYSIEDARYLFNQNLRGEIKGELY